MVAHAYSILLVGGGRRVRSTGPSLVTERVESSLVCVRPCLEKSQKKKKNKPQIPMIFK